MRLLIYSNENIVYDLNCVRGFVALVDPNAKGVYRTTLIVERAMHFDSYRAAYTVLVEYSKQRNMSTNDLWLLEVQ